MLLTQVEFINHPILNNLKINFTDSNGHIYSNIIIVGENGCGKTTLLNELHNYDNSKYIINKEQNFNICGNCLHKSIFSAQDLKYRNSINLISKQISKEEVYNDTTSADNTNEYMGANVMSFNSNNVLNTPAILNENIQDIFKNEKIDKYFSTFQAHKLMDDIDKLLRINGSTFRAKADLFSSGEQELILRLESLKNRIQDNTDMILIDEPETGLHPKWQQEIIPFLLDTLKNTETAKLEQCIQLFVATHSENVLKSMFEREDTLIIRLYKEKNQIKNQNITNMDTRLPCPSLAEIQYLVFDLPSVEYHNQLYGQLYIRFGNQNQIENRIKNIYKNNTNYILNPYNFSRNNNGKIETLPTFIRNATSHPENGERIWNEKDLEISINIMREILE